MTTNYDVARDVVRKVGGNEHNTAIVKAVAVWLDFESGRTIIGNNPWNISGTGTCGSRTHATTGHQFAVYCSLDDGTTATASLLKRRYPSVTKAIVAGDALKFFTALVKSPWDAGHYGGGGKLIASWRSSLSGREHALSFQTPASGGTSAPTATLADYKITDWQAQLAALGISSDPSHIISHDESLKIADLYNQKWPGFFDKIMSRDSLAKTFEGKTVAQAFQGTSTDPITAVANSISALGQAFAGVSNVLGFLLDPENWKYIMAIFVGIPLALFGFYLLAGVSTGPREAV